MNINVYVLTATGRLNSYIDLISEKVEEIALKVTKTIPVDNVDIVISDNPPGVMEEIGVGAFTFEYSRLILISLDPSRLDFKDSIDKGLVETITHELYHCLQWEKVRFPKNLLEALVSEGLANHFEMEINESELYPWNRALSDEQINIFEKRAKEEYFNENFNFEDWFFGFNKNIPKWTGYTLGYKLIKNYLDKHPDKKASSLYEIKPEEFIN